MLLRALRLSDHQTAPLQVRYELRGPRSCSRQFRKNLLRATKVRKCLDDVRELLSARSHSRPGVEQSVLLPSWIGLAETTLLLAPSPIIVWATIQNSYNSPNSRPAAIISKSHGSVPPTFECELSLRAGHSEGGDSPLQLFVESEAQHLSSSPPRLLPGQDDGVARH